MARESGGDESDQPLLALRITEQEIDPTDPWSDDKLDRMRVAARLTKIVAVQSPPNVISLDGRWGTGKTFLLRRWQQELAKDKFRAIYFNAWEDDFCDDPLLAIIGQLSMHFGGSKFKAIAAEIANFGLKFLTTQLTGTAIGLKDLKPESLLDRYDAQLQSKRQMKARIADLARQVLEETGHPLVFIIDELDRCRPTFAIELLERVKHIFEVPNVVFVFGINRRELEKSLKSIYGDIDASVYLRRFFELEFPLPDADPGKFCAYLVQVYRLDEFFRQLRPSNDSNVHVEEFRTASNVLPLVFGQMGFSLRDIDFGIRLVALVGRNLEPGQSVFPEVLCVLVAMKIGNPRLYQRFLRGDSRAAELVNHMNEMRASIGAIPQLPEIDDVRWTLDFLEAAMYAADDGAIAMAQLRRLQEQESLDRPEFLSEETRSLDPNSELGQIRLSNLTQALDYVAKLRPRFRYSAPRLAELMDLFDRDSLTSSDGR